jgi:hypothetical protein
MIWRIAAAALLLGAACGASRAAPIDVFVGYADGLRAGGFFPNPWQGAPGVVFVGNSPGGSFDAGAIRIDNNTALPITVTDVFVNLHPATQSHVFDLWGSNTLLPGQKLIVTQTTDFNFDTSDAPISGCGQQVIGGPDSPAVTITINGVPITLLDTAHVLDTEGFDFACMGNESFAWRTIGGAAGPAGAPEPSSMILLGLGAISLGGYAWRRRKKVAA